MWAVVTAGTVAACLLGLAAVLTPAERQIDMGGFDPRSPEYLRKLAEWERAR